MAQPAEGYPAGGPAPAAAAGRRSRVPARLIVGPTSAVVTEVNDWADASLLLFHEPIRLDLLELDHVMSPAFYDGLSGWKTGLFYKWFKAYFHPLVSHQLQIFATKRFKVAANHVILAQSLQEQRQAASDLRAYIKELLTCITEHLARVEMALLPVIREYFSEEEWQQLALKVLLGPPGKRLRSKQLPWMLAALRVWASPDRVAAFRASLPRTTRFRLEYFWYCSYVNGAAKRLRLIKNDYLPW
ncbi:hypothetical protein KFL_004590050 [Klebsormidium nitens]|uniref:Uncharacterized protein n=1 Tax=Klebsormidium nitens TaxID=105231 RepID=A0A1Y1IDW8_KLENI|nr:hypothetical protein KFL_004590050 [Klebsormidium nitens]|eukprot:GAQ88783.1 hypothetical protein KFL_004590050 [Klebsormidium nitens]